MNRPTVTEALASFAIDETPLSAAAVHGAGRAVLDALGCAWAGKHAPGVPAVGDQLLDWGGKPEATVWWRSAKLPCPEAAFANSVALHALDLDDVHLPSTTHLTSVIVPTAFAVGEARQCSGRALLEAVAMGIEVAARLGIPARECRRTEGYLPTTVFGVFGAAATAARLLGLNAEQTADAFGLAHAHVSGNRQALFDHTLAKRLQPAIAARSGIVSACFAARGLTGARHVAEGQAGLFALYGAHPEAVPDGREIARGSTMWEVERLSYKSYACCGASHPLIRAAVSLAVRHDLVLSDIAEAEVFGVNNPFAGIPWDPAHPTQQQAQFCAPYQVAAAIKHRQFGPAEVSEAVIAADGEVSEAACRIVVAPENPHPGYQTIRIRTADGRTLVARCTRDDVFTGTAMSDHRLTEKFCCITGNEGLAAAIRSLDRIDNCVDFIEEHLHESS